MVMAGQVIVNTEPRLVVFGFDDDEKRAGMGTAQNVSFVEHFGKDRVILRGNATGLVRGVRFREP